MPYFSRLTDIVTCNLTSILEKSDDPIAALEEILREMKEGVAGAERSVSTAEKNVASIETEIGEQRKQGNFWLKQAEEALAKQDEREARLALQRKYEIEDLIAGLEQQLQAAVSTRDHLQTMKNALEARVADARRRQAELREGQLTVNAHSEPEEQIDTPDRKSRIDAELERLKRELGSGS